MAETWSSTQVAAAADVTFRALDYWIRHGMIPLDNPTPGRGHPRRLTLEDALRVKAMKYLTGTGMNAEDINIVDSIENWQWTDPTGSLYIVLPVDKWRQELAHQLGATPLIKES